VPVQREGCVPKQRFENSSFVLMIAVNNTLNVFRLNEAAWRVSFPQAGHNGHARCTPNTILPSVVRASQEVGRHGALAVTI
jgi:hypothetical protein